MTTGDAGGRKRRRLSRSGEFDRVYREGSSHANRYLVVYSFPRPEEREEGLRLGVSVGRKVGGAVERNRIKRALREAFWNLEADLGEGSDYVLVARPEIGEMYERDGMPGLTASLREALELSPSPAVENAETAADPAEDRLT